MTEALLRRREKFREKIAKWEYFIQCLDQILPF